MDNGKELFEEHRDGRSGGIPWMIILDKDGSELVTSVGPNGNCGCPVTSEEIDHFVDMIKQTCSDPDETHLFAVRESLKDFAKKLNDRQAPVDQ